MNNFFTISKTEMTENTILAQITFNEHHPLYEGHFPENPITPGVVQIDAIKKIIENQTKLDLKLVALNRGKFLAIINPFLLKNLEVTINIKEQTDELLRAVCSISKDGKFYLKANTSFTIA